MPRLYLREAEPFLPEDKKMAMERHMVKREKADVMTQMNDPTRKRRLSKRSASLIASDAAICIVEMLQVLALIQSMGLKWSWPKTWLKYTNFIFIFNADAWEFAKIQSGAYTRIQGKETASSDVPVDYIYIIFAWLGFLAISTVAFLFSYLLLHHRQPPYLMVHYAKMERIFLIMVQILTLPLGTAVFRLFHCTGNEEMAVFNSVSCYEGMYWAYVAPSLLIVVALFGAVPIWMAYRIRKQKLAACNRHHDSYLRLKEVEYEAGLDVVWAVQGFHLFSSFRLCAAYYRPIVHMAKLLILVYFSSLFLEIHAQAICMAITLTVAAICMPVFRPFRVRNFNVAMGLSLGSLAGVSTYGAVVASFNPAEIESPWLVEPYSYYILAGISSILVGTLLFWIIWLICRVFCSCCSKHCFPNSPVWPTLLSYEFKVDGAETYKFMAAVLRARAVMDACMRAPSIFAPVHQLSRHIQIINVCLREAEKTRDGMHPTLLHLLDDMTDVHQRLEPGSLFAEKVKENIRQNAANFVALMPAFCQRLAQRDFDLMLVDPVRKRLLLKMSIIAMFVNKNNQKLVRTTYTERGLQQLWDEQPDIVDLRAEFEYHEDLHPLPVTGPDTESQYMTAVYRAPLQLMDLQDSDEEESLTTFLSRVPPVLVLKDENSRSSSLTHLANLTDSSSLTPIGRVETPAEVRQEIKPEPEPSHQSAPEQTGEATEPLLVTSGEQVSAIGSHENITTESEPQKVETPLPDAVPVDALAEVSEIGVENEAFVEDDGKAQSEDALDTEK